nr:mesothelin-like protein [Pan troglodytes]
MDSSSIGAADPRVLENLRRCPRLTAAQCIALNSLLAGGKTSLGHLTSGLSLTGSCGRGGRGLGCCPAGCGGGIPLVGASRGLGGQAPTGCSSCLLGVHGGAGAPRAGGPALDPTLRPILCTRPPGSWTLEGLQALGPLATYISPHLWAQVQEAVGLGFFHSVVASCRVGKLGQREASCFVTSFLESKTKPVSSRPRLSTGEPCVRGNITAATLQDGLFLVHYDCAELESCLDGRILRTNLDTLLQHPLPTECQHVVKAKLAQSYPQGLPEDQLRLITSLVYLYSRTEISQWSITSQDTVVALLAPDVALENQTEAVLQKFLEHNGTVSGALLLAIGGTRLCWMSPQQIQTIHPQELRLAGALDLSSCPQSRKDVLYAKAREAFGSSRTPAAYYRLMRPYLGGALVEELRHLAQANISMDIDTFTSLNPLELQSLDVGNVTALLGHNVGDLQKARSHPTVRAWLRSLNSSTLGQLSLDASPAGPTGPAHGTRGPPSTTHQALHLVHTSGLPTNDAQASTSGMAPAPLRLGPLCPGPSQTRPRLVATPTGLSTSFVHCLLG